MAHGLVLTLGGAPNVPHRVTLPDYESTGDGFLPGEYSPVEPTPIDSVPGMTLERARKLDECESVPLKLVKIEAKRGFEPVIDAPEPVEPETGELA